VSEKLQNRKEEVALNSTGIINRTNDYDDDDAKNCHDW
jgi:hypothetical protein